MQVHSMYISTILQLDKKDTIFCEEKSEQHTLLTLGRPSTLTHLAVVNNVRSSVTGDVVAGDHWEVAWWPTTQRISS